MEFGTPCMETSYVHAMEQLTEAHGVIPDAKVRTSEHPSADEMAGDRHYLPTENLRSILVEFP
jgi:hypothetical protein